MVAAAPGRGGGRGAAHGVDVAQLRAVAAAGDLVPQPRHPQVQRRRRQRDPRPRADRRAPQDPADLAAGAALGPRRAAGRRLVGRQRALVDPRRGARAARHAEGARRRARVGAAARRCCSAATSTSAASRSCPGWCGSAATTSTTSTARDGRRSRSRCSSAGRCPTTRRCASPSEPEAAQHQQRALARGAGLRQHAERPSRPRRRRRTRARAAAGPPRARRRRRRGPRAARPVGWIRPSGPVWVPSSAARRARERPVVTAARRSSSRARPASPPTAASRARPERPHADQRLGRERILVVDVRRADGFEPARFASRPRALPSVEELVDLHRSGMMADG